MYKRVEKLRRQNAAPRQAMIAGQPHMLAYINEAERQMLKRAGGAEAPGPAGVPAYYTWDSNKSFGENLMGSLKETASAIANDISSVFGGGNNDNVYQGPNIDGTSGYTVTTNGNDGYSTQETNYTYGSGDNAVTGTMQTIVDDPNTIATTLTGGNITDAGQTITYPNSGQITLSGQQEAYTDPNYGLNDPNLIQTEKQDGTYVRVDNGTGTQTSESGPVNTGPTAEEIAAAEEAARQERVRKAREAKLGELSNAFGFATDDYFQGLGTSYREGGLSEAFTKAYDDALRGIYDVYKSAGLLSQADVDDDLGILAGAEGGEEGRLNSIVDQYVLANQNYVSGGQSSIADQINALDTVDAINSFNINSAVAPYKEPTEQAVVDFFTDFVKREYDPSYNVDPTAVASGGPRRVSQSVDESGVSGQPSSLAGIFDPVSGNSAKVIK